MNGLITNLAPSGFFILPDCRQEHSLTLRFGRFARKINLGSHQRGAYEINDMAGVAGGTGGLCGIGGAKAPFRAILPALYAAAGTAATSVANAIKRATAANPFTTSAGDSARPATQPVAVPIEYRSTAGPAKCADDPAAAKPVAGRRDNQLSAKSAPMRSIRSVQSESTPQLNNVRAR